MGSVAMVIIVVLGACFALVLRAGTTAGGAPAPKLSPDFATAILGRAGFPSTPHNLFALRERLGVMYLAQARSSEAAPSGWDRVEETCEGSRTDMRSWPQRVLDEIAVADRVAAASVAARCPEMLLATVGTGRGFFGGSVFEPLPLLEARIVAPVVQAA